MNDDSAKFRWKSGQGPGSRKTSFARRLKRWLVEAAIRDPRTRRLALSRIFANYSAEGILCLVPFADHKVFFDPRDDKIAHSLFSGREWQRRQLDRAFGLAVKEGCLKPGGVFVDVGANIGLMTLYAMLSGHFSKGIAIEPEPWNRSILMQNLAINGLSDRVTVVDKAVSSAPGTLSLHRDAKNFGAHSLEPGFVMSPGSTQDVSVDRLDNIISEAGIDVDEVGFVKIDVEGHEFSVLEGMPEVLAAQPPLMVEVTFDQVADRQDGTGEVQRLRRYLSSYALWFDVSRADVDAALSMAQFEAAAGQAELLFV